MTKADILLVDDDPAFAKIMEKRLHNGGFLKTECYRDSRECLNALEEGAKPKFIFLDFSLITLNGLDTLIQIKKIRKSTKVIIITQLQDDELAKTCLEAGASLFLHKSSVIQGFSDELLEMLWPAKGYVHHRNSKK